MGEHLVQFYRDDAILIDEIWRFIGPGIQLGETAVVIATEAHLAALDAKYTIEHSADASPTATPPPYLTLNAETILSEILVDGWPDRSRFDAIIGEILQHATNNGLHTVRVYGEMVALLCAEGNQAAAVELEHLWNELGQQYPFSLLCGYPLHAFANEEDGQAFGAICASHSHVRPSGTYTAPCPENISRTLAVLEQKASALESEVSRRKEIERALQRREQELSDFLENALEGMHRVGPDGKILWANPAEMQLLGYTCDEYIGRYIADFHIDRHVIDDILEKLRRGEALYDQPARLRCKDGSIRHVLINSNALIADGEIISTRCLTRDVTDRVHLEEQLNQKLFELADMDRRKDEFLAMLAHELRNPLAPVMNSLELMRLHEDRPEVIARSRETIARQVALMTRLVDDLLDISRIARGKIDLQMEEIALDYIIERAVEIARPLIDERHHHLTLNLPADTVFLYGDTARLAQVLANLLHNAAKYTDAGGCLSLSACKDGTVIRITVSDNGIGLDTGLQEKVFDLYVQNGNSLTKARGGLGLGLTLVRSLVNLHGGTVAVHSEGLGCGSEFIVTLPLRIPVKEEAAAPSSAEHNVAGTRPRRILIVDDNVDAAESLGEFLKASGHHVHIVHDGVSAIGDALRLRPEVIILDIGMPSMDGYQVARRLRAEAGLTSSLLVAVTGYAQERDRLSAQDAGFDHHLAKPLDISKLATILNTPAQ